jgi:hypothetical protein
VHLKELSNNNIVINYRLFERVNIMFFKNFKTFLFLVLSTLFSFSALSQIDYKSKIEPIWYSNRCINCHGGDGGLYLDSYNTLMTTGAHKPLVEAKDTTSLLIKKLRGTADFGARMPFGGPYLTESEMRTIIQWINEGAKAAATPNIVTRLYSGINKYSLNQNYPNPFNPSTIIKFEIPEPTSVSVKIFNYSGKEVAILVNEKLGSGSYEKEWNAKNLPSGIYYAHLKAGVFEETKKMVLMK